jgi:hypothetical protein
MSTTASNADTARQEPDVTNPLDRDGARGFGEMVRRLASVAGQSFDLQVALRRRSALIGIGLVLLVAACGGGSSSARPAACKTRAQQAIARDLGTSFGAVTYVRSLGNNDMPQCAFTTRVAGRTVATTVNVDDGPQPYFRLLRTVVEASQIFGVPPPGFHAPQGLSGLGPYASWFPNNDRLMATNDRLLLSVTVRWPDGGRNEEVRLARAAIVPYLMRPHGPLNTNDYP